MNAYVYLQARYALTQEVAVPGYGEFLPSMSDLKPGATILMQRDKFSLLNQCPPQICEVLSGGTALRFTGFSDA